MRSLSLFFHSRPPQQRRFLLPAKVAAAAAPGAAFLINPAPSALADTSSVVFSQDHVCAGLSAGEVQTAAGKSATSIMSSTAGGCQVTFSLSSSTAAKMGSSCVVRLVPTALGSDGVDLEVLPAGDCDRVTMSSQIEVSGQGHLPELGKGNPFGSLSASKQALAKIVGSEAISLTMFLHYAKVYWTYTISLILSATPELFDWDNQYWHIHSNSSGSSYGWGNTSYQLWNRVAWHSDGYLTSLAPDVYASSRVAVHVQAGGGYSCSFSMVWQDKGPYPGLHHHQQCWGN